MLCHTRISRFSIVLTLFILTACGGSSSSSSDTTGSGAGGTGGGGTGSVVKIDSDGDGTSDEDDAFPNDATESVDTDADGIGNNADPDDDNDGMPDDFEIQYGLNPLINDAAADLDNDGFSNFSEYQYGTNPADPMSVPAATRVELGADFSIFNDEALSLTSNVSGAGALNYQWTLEAGQPGTFTTPNAASTEFHYSIANTAETYQFKLNVNNSFSSANDTVTVNVLDRIDEAAKYGNPALLPKDVSKLEQRILDNIASEQLQVSDLHQVIFGLDTINYDPTRNSRLFNLTSLSSAMPLLSGSGKGQILAVATQSDAQRTAAFGHNVLVALSNGQLTDFTSHMKNTLDWLLAPHQLTSENTIRVSLMLTSNNNMSRSESWLATHYPNMVFNRCSDLTQLTACIENAHLIITGSENSVAESVVTAVFEQSLLNGQSLLYTHNGSWNSTILTNPILNYFGVKTENPGGAGNYFSQDLASWPSASAMRDNTDALNKLSTLLSNFKNNSFSFNISQCGDGDTNCTAIPAFAAEFLHAANSMQNIIRGFDEAALDIFSNRENFQLEKLIVLLADKYRQSVKYPMDKNSTDTQAFIKALFADKLVYNSRQYNPVPADLGNFSRTNFSHITPTSKTVNVISRQNFRAAGVYALPGQTFTVKRTDNLANLAVKVFINSVRSSSTQFMQPNNKYNRPIHLQSRYIPINAGETITITSPYGGPVQLAFSDTGSNLSLEFSNIGLHPYWRQGDDDTAFAAALTANDYDWTEIATKHFEIHSTRSKMLNTLKDPRWDTPSELAYFITKYHHNYSRVLGGVQGEAIDVVDEINDFATAKDLTIPTWDKVQHFNADQPTCGSGCSGNPYDADWAFNVLAHGDLHEVGHNMEDSRFRFNGFEGHSYTNFYSYYAKSRGQDEDGIAANCQSLNFSNYSTHLLAGDDMTALSYNSWNYGVTLVIELMMHAEENGTLNNGWHLIPRLHILSRNFNDNDDDDAKWNDVRASLGFSSYERSAARLLNNNDWLLIAASFATGLDYRPFFDLMGQAYSSKASAQVGLFGFPPVERAFYLPATNKAYCDSLVGHSKVTP